MNIVAEVIGFQLAFEEKTSIQYFLARINLALDRQNELYERALELLEGMTGEKA